MGYLKIPDGETLTIDTGVVVKFNSTERFDIQGCLHAEGTEELPILFTAVDPDVKWGGMVWDQTPATNPNSVLTHCIFEHSYAYGLETGYNCGGAIRINMVNTIDISHCTFRYNSADKFTNNNPAGGALALFESSIHIAHCIFNDNSSSWGGAIIIGSNSKPVLDNCLFYNNESTFVGGGGGAGLSWENSSPVLVNCTFADNHAVDDGGAYELELGGTTTFTNCIFWGNTADIGANQISIRMDNPLPFLNVYYSDVQDGSNGITPGFQGEYTENIDEDPEFFSIENYPFVPDTNSSPCINVGTLDPQYLPGGWTCPAYCLCGNPRVVGIIDMGCYESPVITGMGDNNTFDHVNLNIFPNPVTESSIIDFTLSDANSVTILLTNIHGQIISERKTTQLPAGRHQMKLETGELSAGIYLCRLQNGDKSATIRVIRLTD
jgi:hypothetical protein